LSANPAPLESQESSSPIILRAVASELQGQYCDTYQVAPWQRLALQVLGRLPQSVGHFAISRFETMSCLDPSRLDGLTIDQLVMESLNNYTGLSGPFPTVTIGAGLGGASAHLSLAMGGPFLPQAFVTTLCSGAKDGDVRQYFDRSAALAQCIARDNPGLLTIQHYDPVHDGWMTRYVNHLRFKLLDLPEAYRRYLRENLQPGGAVCYLDCQAQWLRYRVGERSVFQVGGWGDIPPEEFLEGSPRLAAYCRRAGFSHCDWRLPGFPLERGPESEWGCEPGLGEALQEFCQKEGFRFVPIRLPEPHDYSRLAFQAIQAQLEKENRQPAGVFVEMFSQYDATAVQKAGLLPVWLVFNTWDSLAFLKSMRPLFPPGKPVFFSPLSTFTRTPDMVPWSEWEKALQGLDWRNVGARASHYPSDAMALAGWASPLRKWVSGHNNPVQSNLEAEELLDLAGHLGGE
jgi:hypothetical protein